MRAGKIFGTGFHRTGTTSLDDALNLLGISSMHGPFELEDDPDHAILEHYDAFTDNPIPHLYRRLDARFPGSRFIHTVRPVDEWLRSVEWLFTVGRIKYRWDLEPVVERIHRSLYGVTHFDARVFRDVYLRHTDGVVRYFADRPADLLVLDVTSGDGWAKLCPFVDRPIPDAPFPSSNSATPLGDEEG